MKKIIIIFFIFILSFNYTTAASCLIEKDTSKELKKYMSNFKSILKNIEKEAKNAVNNKKDLEKPDIYNFAVRLYNDTFNFEVFFDEIDFLFLNMKFTEVPEEIDRDYEKLKSENEYVKELASFIQKYNLKNHEISKNICLGVSDCNFKEGKLGDILINVNKNHENIKNVFVKVISGQKDFDKDNFILINKNIFFKDLETNYGKQAIEVCNGRNGTFFDEIKKQTNKIFSNEKSAKEGIKEWKKTWALISGIDTMQKEQLESIEKDLLKREMSRQGVPSESQENIFENLDKFNKEGFSLNNNFITNTFKQIENEFNNEFQSLKEEVTNDFFENHRKKSKGLNNNENLTNRETLKSQNNSDKIKNIQAQIDRMYIETSTYASLSKYNNDNLRTRIIGTHDELSKAIKKLNDTCKKAVKICNQQDSGNGDCGDCNW